MKHKNNAYSVLNGSITNVATAITLATGTGSRFPTDNFKVTLIGYDGNGNENAWEICLCTSRTGDILTVQRGQEGTTAVAWANATRIENRITAGTLDETLEPTITAGTTSQYWRGDKTWRDFFTDVRAATLTGLSTATNAVITAADTVLSALGKLQKQITDHLANTSNPHSTTAAQVGAVPASGGDFTGAVAVSVSSSSDALRITQTGTGNALVVEDSANPDSTPFVIDASGGVIIGATAAIPGHSAQTGNLHIDSTAGRQYLNRWNSDANGSQLTLGKAKTTSIGTHAAVANGDVLGTLDFQGSDGSAFMRAASIAAASEGTPASGSVPGRLVFNTTPSGSGTPVERMRIDSDGGVGIGSVNTIGRKLVVSGNVAGATTAYGQYSVATFQSDVTTHGYGIRSQNGTQAASFTLPALSHFGASQATIGAGSTVTNQYGFNADSSLVGATNNYGFYSNIAAATGCWNFYANGTAENYFGGATTINVNSSSDALRITQAGAGNALVVEDEASPDSSPFVVTGIGVVVAGATAASTPVSGGALLQTNGSGNGGATVGAFQWSSGATSALGGQLTLVRSKSGTVGTHTSVISGDALGSVLFEGSDGANFVRGAAVQAFVDGTPGAGSMPGRLVFSTTPSGSGTPVERMRISSNGNINIATLGARITGDFSNATLASRVAFQSSVTNGNTTLTALPNGTATVSQFAAYSGSDPANTAFLAFQSNGATNQIISNKNGTGTTLPLVVMMNGAESMRIETDGTLKDGSGLELGWKTLPQNSQSLAYTLVASDAGKHILHPSADTTARTFTIPSNASVPYQIGTAITFVNQNGAGAVTIAITTDTMRLAGTGATGSRTLAANGIATALKVTATEWIISGTGLT